MDKLNQESLPLENFPAEVPLDPSRQLLEHPNVQVRYL